MYNLHLSGEPLEIRDTVRDFVDSEIKPVVLKAARLDRGDRSLPLELLDKASQMGLRTLTLSETFGGAGPTQARIQLNKRTCLLSRGRTELEISALSARASRFPAT
jgi:alkylation response protein AidB-like acyl-CoA dehydrogenase